MKAFITLFYNDNIPTVEVRERPGYAILYLNGVDVSMHFKDAFAINQLAVAIERASQEAAMEMDE